MTAPHPAHPAQPAHSAAPAASASAADAAERAPTPTPQDLRAALGRFATGVTIITCLDTDAAPVGLTANSFAALSLDPPLVLWSLRKASNCLPAFAQAGHFAVNVLAETQVDLSRRFASTGDDKFAEGGWSPGQAGVPVLTGSAAVFECAVDSQQDAGDHVLFIGRVLRLSELALAPLLFQGGHYRMLGEVL